jgi:hypothetical protein
MERLTPRPPLNFGLLFVLLGCVGLWALIALALYTLM